MIYVVLYFIQTIRYKLVKKIEQFHNKFILGQLRQELLNKSN